MTSKAAFVRQQTIAHKEGWLRYQVGLRAVERDLTEAEIASLLDGAKVELAAPVLRLFTDDWSWKGDELSVIVQRIAPELGLKLDGREGKPTDILCDACRDWAIAESQQLVANLKQQ